MGVSAGAGGGGRPGRRVGTGSRGERRGGIGRPIGADRGVRSRLLVMRKDKENRSFGSASSYLAGWDKGPPSLRGSTASRLSVPNPSTERSSSQI